MLVIQGNPIFSRQNMEEDPANWSRALLGAAAGVLGSWAATPAWRQEHRWEHARVQRGDTLSNPVLLRWPGGGELALCGEAFNSAGGLEGVLLYLRQEGRGIGLLNKIRAYSLQDMGLDTVEANLALGFRDEERDFAVAAHMIHSLEIKSIQLMTNNPFKLTELEKHGVIISRRLQHELPHNPHNQAYLATKVARMGHYLRMDGETNLDEQGDVRGEMPRLPE